MYLAHLTEKESEEGEDDEVGAAGEVRQFVQLKGGRDREENQLHTDRHDRAYGEMILVQNIDRHAATPMWSDTPLDKLSQDSVMHSLSYWSERVKRRLNRISSLLIYDISFSGR